MQRRLLAHKELEKARESRVDVVLRRLRGSLSFDVNLFIVKAFLLNIADSLEVILLLVWRHVDYYSAHSGPSLRRSSGTSPASSGRPDASSLKRSVLAEDEISSLLDHVKHRLTPVLERLDKVHLVSLASFRCLRNVLIVVTIAGRDSGTGPPFS